MIFYVNTIMVIPTLLLPRSVTVVNILGSQKCALLLDIPYIRFKNWPDDDSMSRNMSPHLWLTIKLVVFWLNKLFELLHQLVKWQTFRFDVRNMFAFIYKKCNDRKCSCLWLLAWCAENTILRRNFESVNAVTVLWSHLWPARRHSQWSASRHNGEHVDTTASTSNVTPIFIPSIFFWWDYGSK